MMSVNRKGLESGEMLECVSARAKRAMRSPRPKSRRPPRPPGASSSGAGGWPPVSAGSPIELAAQPATTSARQAVARYKVLPQVHHDMGHDSGVESASPPDENQGGVGAEAA